MTLDAATQQSAMAAHLIESVLGAAQQAHADLVMKLAKLSLSQNISTAGLNGAVCAVDLIV